VTRCGEERSSSHRSSCRWKAPRFTTTRSLFADRAHWDESRWMRSGGSLQDPCAGVGDHGCSRRVELGLDRRRSRLRDGLAVPWTRCPRLVCWAFHHPRLSQEISWGVRNDALLAAPMTLVTASSGESVSRLRLVHTCGVRRTRRVCPRFVSCCRSRSTTHAQRSCPTRKRWRVNGG